MYGYFRAFGVDHKNTPRELTNLLDSRSEYWVADTSQYCDGDCGGDGGGEYNHNGDSEDDTIRMTKLCDIITYVAYIKINVLIISDPIKTCSHGIML